MKKKLRFLCLATIIICLALSTRPVTAEDAKVPTLTLDVYLSQSNIRLNELVTGSITLQNPTPLAIDNVDLEISLPEAVMLKQEDCQTDFDVSQLNGFAMAGYTTRTWNVCYKLDPRNASSGTFNISYLATYTWGVNSAAVVKELPITVDLIGVTSVMGIPLAFAGFVLPGLMFLVVLKVFKMPWAVNMSIEEKIIYGIFISLLFLWPTTALAQKYSTAAFLQNFNLNEQVSLQRLGCFVLLGLIIGLIGGLLYFWRRTKRAKLEISILDNNRVVAWKSLQLNRRYTPGTVEFVNKKDNNRVIGSHFAVTDTLYQVFPEFKLTISEIQDDHTQAQVKHIIQEAAVKAGLAPQTHHDKVYKTLADQRKTLSAILKAIEKDKGECFPITNPVAEIESQTQTKRFKSKLNFYEIKKDEYLVTQNKEKKCALVKIED